MSFGHIFLARVLKRNEVTPYIVLQQDCQLLWILLDCGLVEWAFLSVSWLKQFSNFKLYLSLWLQ